jgi:hypothetical protein
MPNVTLRRPLLRKAFEKLIIAGFTLEVEALTDSGTWSRTKQAYQGVAGTAWLTLPCRPGAPDDDVVRSEIQLKPWLEVVSEVEWPETQISLTQARRVAPDASLGSSIEVPLGLAEDRLSATLNDATAKVDWSMDLLATHRVLMSFTGLSVRRVSGQRDTARVLTGSARYPFKPRVPERLGVEIDGLRVELTELELTPSGASAKAVLTLPDNIGDFDTCAPAKLDLGSVTFGTDCSLFAERPDQHWGPWLVGDTGLVAEGKGFILDASDALSPRGAPARWRGLRLFRGAASGGKTIPKPSNTGWLGGDFSLQDPVVTASGLAADLSLRQEHRFATLNPAGYAVTLQDARLALSASAVASGRLGPGEIELPSAAVRDPGANNIGVPFSTLSVQPNLDAAGELSAGADLAWGELSHPGNALIAQTITGNHGLAFFPADPRPSFMPARPGGFIELPYQASVADLLADLDAADATGVTFRGMQTLSILSPDRPGGQPLDFDFVDGWLRVDSLGLDGELTVPAKDGREPLGEPARNGYVGGMPFDAQLVYHEKTNLVGRWVSSASYASKFNGTLKLPPPSGIPDLAFTDLNLTSTANFVGGIVGLPEGGVTLDYWQLDLVPSGAAPPGDTAVSGVLSVRTGHIVLTSAGIDEPVHFADPFRLISGEILADGNLGDLQFDSNSLGQQFDGLPYSALAVRLSPYVAGTADPFLATCGTVHLNFFGPVTVNIRDARHADGDAPFLGRYVTVPKSGEGNCPDTDLHITGAWQDSTSAGLLEVDFPDADMDYNEQLQNGFIGKGHGDLAFLAGGSLEASIEARSGSIDMRLSSRTTRNLDLGLYAVLGGMSEINGCVRIEDTLLRTINLGGMLEQATSSGFGILAPKTGHVVEVNLTVTPNSLDMFADGSILMQVAGAAVDLYAQTHLLHDYRRGTVEGEVLGRIDCNSVLAGLEGDGQVTWFAGPDSSHLQGNVRVYVAGWMAKGGLEGGFFVGHNTPKHLAWVLQPSSPHFGVSPSILPDRLTGVFGYGQLAFGTNFYVFGGGVELYAGLGAFSEIPQGLSSAIATAGVGLPYVVGSCGVRLHGEILGGLLSASGWADLDVRGPVPLYFEGTLGLGGCIAWVLCASVDLNVGVNSGGFYVS